MDQANLTKFYRWKPILVTGGAGAGPINVGNPVECTVLELAERIIKITGSSSSIVFLPALADDPKQRRPDISLARSVLAWKPLVLE
jgi:UDP-glucuronate decarboxylase